MADGFRQLPLLFRVCVAVGLAFALTQAEATYDRHRDYAPVARAEDRASGQAVTTLPYGEVERWLTASVDEGRVRDRWREGNTAFEEAYVAVAAGAGDDTELRGDRCYVFPVTGEVRTRLRGTVALAAFCFEGEAPAPAPVEVGLEELTGA